MKLESNRALYEYLISLSSKLKGYGADALSQLVTKASRHAAGMSAEFLGESRIALQQVARSASGILSQEEFADLSDVLEQLDYAFRRRRP